MNVVEYIDLFFLIIDFIAILIYFKFILKYILSVIRRFWGRKRSYFLVVGINEKFRGDVNAYIENSELSMYLQNNRENYSYIKMPTDKGRVDHKTIVSYLNNTLDALFKPKDDNAASKQMINIIRAKQIHVFVERPNFIYATIAEMLLDRFDCKIIFYKYTYSSYYPLPPIKKKRKKQYEQTYFLAIGISEKFRNDVNACIKNSKLSKYFQNNGGNYSYIKMPTGRGKAGRKTIVPWLNNTLDTLFKPKDDNADSKQMINAFKVKRIHVFVERPNYICAVAEMLLDRFDCKIIFYEYKYSSFFSLPPIKKKRGKKHDRNYTNH